MIIWIGGEDYEGFMRLVSCFFVLVVSSGRSVIMLCLIFVIYMVLLGDLF